MNKLAEHAAQCGIDLTTCDAVSTEQPRDGWVAHDILNPETREVICYAGFWLRKHEVTALAAEWGIDCVFMDKA